MGSRRMNARDLGSMWAFMSSTSTLLCTHALLNISGPSSCFSIQCVGCGSHHEKSSLLQKVDVVHLS